MENLQSGGKPCFEGAAILKIGVCYKLPGGAGLNHCKPNDCFMEG
jgi:hypothetical protein